MLERQIDQHERRATLENDLKVREQQRRVFAEDQSLPNRATTFHQFAQADAQPPRGRFSAVEAQVVVGANPVIDYPAGPAWCADPGSQLLEPPLDLDNPALEPLGLATEAQGNSGDAVVAPSSTTPLVDDVEHAASSLSSHDDPEGTHFPPRPARISRDPGRPQFRRRI